jgi:hypothetical protein
VHGIDRNGRIEGRRDGDKKILVGRGRGAGRESPRLGASFFKRLFSPASEALRKLQEKGAALAREPSSSLTQLRIL